MFVRSSKLFVIFTLLQSVFAAASWAGGIKCGFNKKVGNAGLVYTVTSNRADGCAVQILSISATRNGKQVARYRSDTDIIAHTAFAADLDGDGTPELVVASRAFEKMISETVDIYKLDGSKLNKTSLPNLDNLEGYRGGDSYWIDDKQLVRTFPLYEQDKQTGIRTLKYEMVNNKLELYVQNDEPLLKPDREEAKSKSLELPVITEEIVKSKQESSRGTVPSASTISGVEIILNSILIRTAGTVGKFKIMTLASPERIAIDFVKGRTEISEKSIPINKFGISKVRIGKNRDFLRLVFDSNEKKFPSYTITPVDEGLKIEFKE